MTNQERRDAQLPYISDETVCNEQKRARILTQKLNTMDRSDFDGIAAVVTKDIPAWSIAAGNPCRVLRRITEEDRKYYFRNREFDEESWAAICGREKK